MNGTDTGGRLTSWPIGFAWPQPGTPFLDGVGRALFGRELWRYAPPACRGVSAGWPCVVHFTQMYGGVIGVILVGVVAWALSRRRPSGYVFWQFALWEGVRSLGAAQPLEEPFRDNPLSWPVYDNTRAGIGLFTLTQLVSIPIVLLATYMLLASPARTDVRRASRPGAAVER